LISRVANEEATLELALLWQIYLRCVFAQIDVSAVRATSRWRSTSYELGDYVTHGWQASLRRRSVVNLTIGALRSGGVRRRADALRGRQQFLPRNSKRVKEGLQSAFCRRTIVMVRARYQGGPLFSRNASRSLVRGSMVIVRG
jgi:hypothetical protein